MKLKEIDQCAHNAPINVNLAGGGGPGGGGGGGGGIWDHSNAVTKSVAVKFLFVFVAISQ